MTAPQLTFVGTGAAFDPARPNTSLLYSGSRTVLMDCGYGVPHALWRHLDDPHALDAIWLSHGHADHCFGLPAALLRMRFGGRERPLTVLGGPGTGETLWRVLDTGYPGSFAPDKGYPIEVREVAPGEVGRLGALEVRTALTGHKLPNHAVRLEGDGVSLGYSGDGAPTEASEALFAGADVVVHECYFDAHAPTERSHAGAAELLPLAERAGVGTLCLVHVAPEHRAAVAARAAAWTGRTRVLLPDCGERIEVATR